MHARSYSDGMETLGTAQDDVSTVRDFASQVRALCAQLTANPFNTPAAEKLLDLLLEDAPAVDLAFERVLRSVIHGPASTGAPILDMLGPTLHRPERRARRRRGGLKSALMSHRPHHVLLRARRTVVEDSFSRQLSAPVGDHLGQVVLHFAAGFIEQNLLRRGDHRGFIRVADV